MSAKASYIARGEGEREVGVVLAHAVVWAEQDAAWLPGRDALVNAVLELSSGQLAAGRAHIGAALAELRRLYAMADQHERADVQQLGEILREALADLPIAVP
jgi:hypothetical protein